MSEGSRPSVWTVDEQRVARADIQVGRRIPGLTNARLAAGRGSYVGDIDLPGMSHLAFLRSPHAHARIRAIDASAAHARAGVLLVLTGADAVADMRPIPGGWDAARMNARPVTWHALAPERVRYVGEAVAAVVAEDRWTAYAALDDIEVDYEELPAVTDPFAALEPGSALVEPEWGENVLVRRRIAAGDAEAALARATHRAAGRVRSNRITGVPIEARGMLASHDAGTGRLTFWESTQNPHPLRTILAETLGLSESAVRVIQPDVGGAFGLKQPPFQEEPVVAHASRRLGRPVRWLEERAENFAATGHARDFAFEYEVGFEPDGAVSALRVHVVADVGAPTSLVGWGMVFAATNVIPGMYRVADLLVTLSAVVTNTCPWNAYRAFGKDAGGFLMDRVMDHVARETGLDPHEVRRRNMVPADAFPYPTAQGGMMDSGDYEGVLDQLLEAVDVPAVRREQADARREGRRLGLGIGAELTPEGVAIPGSLMISAYDGATVRIDPGGGVRVLVGVTTPGSGSETGIAQIAADTLGVPLSVVRVVSGDTDACPYGLGNYSSRSVMIGGSAVREACLELRAKLGVVAGSLLGADPGTLVHAGGTIAVAREPARAVAFRAVVDQVYRHTFGKHADMVEPGLEATRYWRSGNIYHQPETQGRFSTYPTWPNGAAACLVEVDPDTGLVKVLRWWLVEDAGTIVNPLLAEANLHGAVAQGLGSALTEAIAYDGAGQLLTATLMDYTIPTAVEVPSIWVGHHETPSPFTPLGAKGVGESGLSSALGALASAVEDAFPELDLRLDTLPLTPERVWRALREARPRAAAGAGAGDAGGVGLFSRVANEPSPGRRRPGARDR